jgi:hypothetical protein
VFAVVAAYNTMPWTVSVARGVAFVVNPLSLLLSPAPTFPAAWAGRPKLNYRGGLGLIAAVQYDNTPVGPYSELLFMVGPWQSSCNGWTPSSIVRIWVDSSATCDAGRRIWGIPKQLATFEWREQNATKLRRGSLGVKVTDAVTNEVVFNSTAHDTSLSLGWLSSALPKSLKTVHWPIDANQHRQVPFGTVPAYSASEDADITSKGFLARSRPISTTLHLDYAGVTVNYARAVFVNQAALTGHHAKPTLPLGVLGVGASIRSHAANPVWRIYAPTVC